MSLSRREFIRLSSSTPALLATRRLIRDTPTGYCQLPPYPIVNFVGDITKPENIAITAFRIHTNTNRQIAIPHPEDYMQLNVVSPQIPFLELDREALLDFQPVETSIVYRSALNHSYGTAKFPLTEVLKQDGLALTMSYVSPKPVNLYIGHGSILSTPCTNYAEISANTRSIDEILLILSRGMYKLQTTSDNQVFSILEPSEELYFYFKGLHITPPTSANTPSSQSLVTA